MRRHVPPAEPERHAGDGPEFVALASEAWRVRDAARRRLVARGAAAVPTLIAGTAHPSARVRAACVELMDHLGDERCCSALRRALRDPTPLVRRHAVHAVGCQRCKPRPLPIDVVDALIERVAGDPSVRVRRVAVHQLGLQAHDPRTVRVLERLVAESRDTGLVSRARQALDAQRRRAASCAVPDAAARDR